MMVSTRRRSRPVVVGVLVGIVVGLGAGCGGSETQTGKVTVMQFVHGTVTAVIITTANGQKVQASVPANLTTSLRPNQTVEIKKVSGKWEVTKIGGQPSGTSTSSGTSTPPAASTPSTSSTSAASLQACLQKAGFTVAVKAPYRLDEQAGATNTMEVTSSSGALHRILFWKTTTRATEAAYIFGGGYRAFGTITIDHANTPSAKKIESCFH